VNYYQLSKEEIFKNLNTNSSGLTQKEAETRLRKDGKNIITNHKKKTRLKKFLNQFNNIMIIILLITATISGAVSKINKEPYTDTIVILMIVILNAVLGFIEQQKADNAIEKLTNLQTKKVKIKRNQQIMLINSEEIVKGDVLVLEAGDIVPADARITWEASLKIDESTLTGESIPIEKKEIEITSTKPLSERKNMIYSGTSVVYGKCHAIVCETGQKTEFGKIAESIKTETHEITPLQQKITEISKFLSWIVVIAVICVFLIGMIKHMPIMEVVMLSISLAVAAIPEGLPAIITIILALGASSLAKKNLIVRKMSSIEALGSVEIICTDKTGTITENKMKVKRIYDNQRIYDAKERINNQKLIEIMVLNNDVEKNNNNYLGDPTEIALYKYCEKKINIRKFQQENKRINELPFDSNRKIMSTINKTNNQVVICTKGSFEAVIKRCTKIYENKRSKILNEKRKTELYEIEKNASKQGDRVLAFAYRNLKKDEKIDETIEKDLIFLGLVSIADPPRKRVKEAIEECKKAGIKPIMLTGDSLETATSIAKEVGMIKDDKEAILGDEIENKDEKELQEIVKKYSVYARISPLTKLSIVNAWKKNNKIVAMAGDGVNDSPAIKKADIGIGMGITGTEVSKEVADIVLADDKFETIVTAIKEGKRIFNNIKNVLVYLLTGNIAEILIICIGMLFGIEIFLPIQLLYINLITDSIPAICLAFEKESNTIIHSKQNHKKIFTKYIVARILSSSILKTVAILGIYFINIKLYSKEIANTMAFLSLILIEISYAYSCKNQKENVINKRVFNNKYLNKGIIFLLIIQGIIFLTPIKNVFQIQTLNIVHILYSIVLTTVVFVIGEYSKNILKEFIQE